MPQLSHFGSVSARGFGLTLPGGGGPNISPFIARITTPSILYGSVLFTDGSLLVLAGGWPFGDFTVLNKTSHAPGASKRLAQFVDYYTDIGPATADEGTLAYIEAYARVDETNTLVQTRRLMNNFFWGGSPGTTAVYDSASGSTFLTSGLYATGSSSYTTPHARRISSAGNLVANMNFSTNSSFNAYETVLSSAVNSSYLYVAVADYDTTGKPLVWRFGTSGGGLGTGTPYAPNFSSSTADITTLATDSAGNLYFGAYDGTNGGTTLFKYNSSMSSKLASVRISDYYVGGGIGNGGAAAVDSITGDVYWLIGTGGSTALLLKTNSSLTPQFARQVSINVGGAGWKSLQVVGNVLSFRNQDSGYVFVLPKDGSKTGTYNVGGGTVTYSSLSLPSYATVSAGWTAILGYNTPRTFNTSTPTESTGTAFSVSSLNL